jgi:hypothetical protein
MKIAIAVFTVLIVGSNASLLGGLVNPGLRALDAASATTKAQGFLNSFLSQVNPIAASAIQNITQQVQTASQNFQTGLNGAVAAVQGQLSVSDAAQLGADIAKAIADFTTNATALIKQTTAAINSLGVQIVSNATQAIQQLGSEILSGNLAVQCFNKEVPQINEKITELVGVTQTRFAQVVDNNLQVINGDIATFQNIYNGIQNAIQTGTIDIKLFETIIVFPAKVSADLSNAVPNFETAVAVIAAQTAVDLAVIAAAVVTCN